MQPFHDIEAGKTSGFALNIEYSSKNARYPRSDQPCFFYNSCNFNRIELNRLHIQTEKTSPLGFT